MALPDLDDPELREALAEAAYYEERLREMAIDREMDLDPEAAYFCMRWQEVSPVGQAPYRAAVDTTLKHVKGMLSVA